MPRADTDIARRPGGWRAAYVVAATALVAAAVLTFHGRSPGVVAPPVSAASVAPDVVRIPILRPHPADAPPEAARFSHWAHDQYGCYTCHTAIFPWARVGFTHDDMEQGRFCGSCHDGRQVWGPRDAGVTCERCHVPSGGDDVDPDDLFD